IQNIESRHGAAWTLETSYRNAQAGAISSDGSAFNVGGIDSAEQLQMIGIRYICCCKPCTGADVSNSIANKELCRAHRQCKAPSTCQLAVRDGDRAQHVARIGRVKEQSFAGQTGNRIGPDNNTLQPLSDQEIVGFEHVPFHSVCDSLKHLDL